MGFRDWLWGVWEYTCFLLAGIVIALHEGNPYTRIMRRYILKMPSPQALRDEAVASVDPSVSAHKAAIVTGGNAGIGVETCYFLLKAGYHVIIGCRSAKLGQEAVDYLIKECAKVNIANPRVEVIPLDLSSLQSVSEFSAAVKARNLPVSILVNNAGVMFMDNNATKEGFEIHFGVNHLGHFKLTMDLLEVLAKNGPSRIVTVTSDTYYMGTFDLSRAKGDKFHRWWSYCNSKLVNLLFSHGLHRHLEAAGLLEKVKIYAVHPGCVHTGITRGAHPLINYLYGVGIVRTILNLVTPRDGSCGSIYTALSKDVENQSGLYFHTTYLEKFAKNAVGKEDQEDELLKFSEECTNTNLARTLQAMKKA